MLDINYTIFKSFLFFFILSIVSFLFLDLPIDKFKHITISYIIFILLFWAISYFEISKNKVIFIIFLLFIPISVGKETLDSFEAYNKFDFFDILANYFGVLCATLVLKSK